MIKLLSGYTCIELALPRIESKGSSGKKPKKQQLLCTTLKKTNDLGSVASVTQRQRKATVWAPHPDWRGMFTGWRVSAQCMHKESYWSCGVAGASVKPYRLPLLLSFSSLIATKFSLTSSFIYHDHRATHWWEWNSSGATSSLLCRTLVYLVIFILITNTSSYLLPSSIVFAIFVCCHTNSLSPSSSQKPSAEQNSKQPNICGDVDVAD